MKKRKKLSQVFNLIFTISKHGIAKDEEISWVRNELNTWFKDFEKNIS